MGKFVKADILIEMDNGHLMIPYEVRCSAKGDNEPYSTRTYYRWALSGPVAGSSRQVYANCIQTGIEQVGYLPHIESSSEHSRTVSCSDQKCINLRDVETVQEGGPNRVSIPRSVLNTPHPGVTGEAKGGKVSKCINITMQDRQNGEAKVGKARIAIEYACKRSSISVNNRCLQGHYLTDTPVHVVLRFWPSNYAAGVKCMYTQYNIPENDTNTLRFF